MQKSLKIALFGATGSLCQLDRIALAFESLGHTVTVNDYQATGFDIIYANDVGAFNNAIYCHKKYNQNAKLVLNVLDCPLHLHDYSEWKLIVKNALANAHVVTTISNSMAAVIQRELGVTAKVIYNPIKPVVRQPIVPFELRVKSLVSAGRLLDLNKRFYIAAEAFLLLKKKPEFSDLKYYTAGPENPGLTEHLGIISDGCLADLYNNTQIYVCCTRNAGLELPPIEAAIAGCVPIVPEDMTTAGEFYPEELVVKPNADAYVQKIVEIYGNPQHYVKLIAPMRGKLLAVLSPQAVAQRILEVANG